MSGLTFPNTAFAIVFVASLVTLLSLSSWIDWKTQKIPKRLSVSLFLAGVVLSVIRGFWAGAEGLPVWVLNWPSAVPGAIDGFLFSLSGSIVAFVVFFALWATGIFLGGGDVKLVTAAGAWLGPTGVLLAAFLSIGVFTIIGLGRIAYELSLGVMPSLAPRAKDPKDRKARRRISYSLSFTVGVVLVLLYAFRVQLGLMETS